MATSRILAVLLVSCCLACGEERSSSEQDGTAGLGGMGVAGAAGASVTQAGAGGASAGLGPAGATSTQPSAGSGGAGSGGAPMAGAGGAAAAGAGAGGAGMGAGEGGAAGGVAGQAGAAAGGAGGAAGSSGDDGPCPASGEPCRILPLGDSITFGIGYDGGYRVDLFRRANADGKSITFTGAESNGPSMVGGVAFPRKHEGHSGWKIAQLESLIPTPALAEPPHIVLLMIGTNDVAQNDDLANAPERLDSLLGKLVQDAPDALIVVATVIPLSFGGGGIQSYNAAVPTVVEARAAAGEHMLLVDMFTGFPLSELGDGVHPNQQGYERMAGVWYGAIDELLN